LVIENGLNGWTEKAVTHYIQDHAGDQPGFGWAEMGNSIKNKHKAKQQQFIFLFKRQSIVPSGHINQQL
jgi:GTP-binding protein EngB required for normal cell division